MFRCGSLALWLILATRCSADASHARELDGAHLVTEAPSPRPLPSEAMPDRESSDSIVMVDPEDVEVPPPRNLEHAALFGAGSARQSTALASPIPQPQSAQELMRTDRGVLLSIPLPAGDKAKAMKEAATVKCSNACATSYDGICSDGATSEAFCTGAKAFGAAGRGTCAVAEGSECELGSDCALRPCIAQCCSSST